MRRAPTPRRRRAAPPSCIQVMRDNGTITAEQAANAEPASVAIVPNAKQNSVRYFTDWVLPQLDTLIDETVQPIEVWTTLDPEHAEARRPGDQRQRAGRRAGRAGRARPRRRGAGDGRRPRLCRARSTTGRRRRRASPAPRSNCSSTSPRSRPGTSPTTWSRPIRSTSTAGARATTVHLISGSISMRQAFAQSINTVVGAARPGGRLRHRRRHGAALRHHHQDRHQSAITLGSSKCG